MDGKGTVTVSVCCITYNHAPYLRQCLEGMLMQKTTFDYEILLHDDASTDGTTDIVKEYAAAYPDLIRPVIQTENQYSTKTRAIVTTYLLPLAKGKYIALCEGDDYWTDPLKLQKQVDAMDADPEISICTHVATDVFANGSVKTYRRYDESRVALLSDVIHWKHRYWPTASFMYQKELMKNYPRVCLTCFVGDAPLVLYLAIQGKVYYLNEVMSVYRRRTPGSHTDRFWRLDDTVRHQEIQTEFDLLDYFNARTGYQYDLEFVGRKLRIQYSLLVRRRKWRITTYYGFFDDLRRLSFFRRMMFLSGVYLLPVLRGSIFRIKGGKR